MLHVPLLRYGVQHHHLEERNKDQRLGCGFCMGKIRIQRFFFFKENNDLVTLQ